MAHDRHGNRIGTSIGELPVSDVLTGAEKILLFQDGNTRQADLQDLFAFGLSGPPGLTGPAGLTGATGNQGPIGPPNFGSNTTQFQEFTAAINGAQTATVSGAAVAVLLVTINGLIQPFGSFSFASPLITYPSSLSIIAGDVLGAYVVFN